ncbi:MAG: hypothetical protein HOW97_08480, partial [Catenulispora sp.]|nr:hypothetical protein [Catenulispora sp.]
MDVVCGGSESIGPPNGGAVGRPGPPGPDADPEPASEAAGTTAATT